MELLNDKELNQVTREQLIEKSKEVNATYKIVNGEIILKLL
jgi:hypothetical protein